MALTSITKDFVVRAGALTEGTNFVTSSTGQTGTLQVNGGAAIAKNLIVGTTATIWGDTNLQGNLIVGGYSRLQLLTATIFTATSANIIGNETVGGNLAVTGLFTATGASELGSTLKVTGNALFNGAVNTFSGALFVTGTNILTVGTGATTLGGTLTVAGVTNVTNTTTANNAGGTGALVIGGGVYIGDNLIVKSTAWNTATNTANAIYTAGGIYADKGLTVAGPTLFKDAVTFAGTTTYVYSTQTVYTDNILNLHVPPGGIDDKWTLDDGKDVGFRFHYYTNSTDTNAALVLANDTKYLEWYNAGAENNTGTFVGASYGTFQTGNIYLKGTTNATNTTTGAFQITNGGAGIGGNVWAGGLAATNLTTASGIVYSIGGKLQNSEVTWNSSSQQLEGRIAYTNTATNITGGASGSLPYQTGAGATTMLPIGTNGYILQVVGGNPTWTSVSGLTSGNATTATNIAGGLKDQIPYQSAPGQTVFNAGLLFNGTTFTATNIVVSNNANSTGYNNGTGALQVKGGAAINNDLWVGGDINLQGSLFLKGVGLDQITGSTGTFDFVIIEGTGTSLTVSDGSTFGGLTTVTNTTAVSSAVTGAFQVKGGVGVSGGIFAGGIVTATLFSGTGTQLQTQLATASANYYPTFVDSNNVGPAGESFYTTSSFTLNPATGAVGVGGTLTVTGQSFLNGGTTTTSFTATSANILGPLTVSGYSQLQLLTATIFTATSANIIGNETVGGTLTVTGLTTLNGGTTTTNFTATNANIIGNAQVGGAFTVTGYTTLGLLTATITTVTQLTVLGNETVGGNLTVTGYSTFGLVTATTFTATSANIIGNETVGGNLTVTGYSQLQLLTATIFTATSANIIGNETVGGNLTVTGYSTFGLVTATVFTATSANIIGNETVGGTLGVTGRTTLNDAVINNTITATNLVVTGSATLPPVTFSALTVTNLTVTNNETVGGTLVVTGQSSLNGGLSTGAFTATGIVYITNTTDSNATNNGALVVSGGVGIAKNLVVGTAVTVGSVSTQTVVPAMYSNNSLYSSYTSQYIVSNSEISLDTFSSTAYRTAKYIIQIVDGTKIQVEELLVFHDGTNVYMTEYAIASSQGELGTFDATLAANTVTLKFTANYTPTSMTIKVVRTAITL